MPSGNGVRRMADEVLLELYDTDDIADEETEERAQGLRNELLGLVEVSEVSRAVVGPAPPGARAIDIGAIGGLVLAVEPTVAALSRIVSVVRDWLAHRGGGQPHGESVKITVNGQSIELAAATAAQQQALVDQFIRTAAKA
jgi:hypothetical protein